MKLTEKLALSQLKFNKRRTIWTFIGIMLASAMLTTIYGLGFGSGMDWVDRITTDSSSRVLYENFISGLASVMSILVLSISVIVISNAFRVSAGERSAQFGILKSVGATKKQITQTVVYEGIYLTMIAVPLGIIIGLIVQAVGVRLINIVIEPLLSAEDRANGDHMFQFVFSSLVFIMSFGVSALTVFLSAWLPARKVANISAINAIRGTGDVQINNKKIRGGRVVNKIFKFEGTLARTFLKRNKKNFRATVIAMSFSVAIFIIAGSFFDQMTMLTEVQWGTVDANVQLGFDLHTSQSIDCDDVSGDEWWSESRYDNDGNLIAQECFISIAEEVGISVDEMQEIHESLQAVLNEGDSIFGIGFTPQVRYSAFIPYSELSADVVSFAEELGFQFRDDQHEFNIALRVVDDMTASKLAELAGVPIGSNIVINQALSFLQDGRVIEHELLKFTGQTLTLESWTDDGVQEIELHGQLTPKQIPAELGHGWMGELRIIVPEANINRTTWWIETQDPSMIAFEGRYVLEDFVSESDGLVIAIDMAANADQERNVIALVTLMTFGFVGVLIIIGLTNVISTISENVKARAKEFAVLQSVGMTSGGIGRMLSLETVFSTFKSLFIGGLIGILGSYGIFHAIDAIGVFEFRLPWMWITYSILGVFIITWLTMRFAARKLKNQNIIETIRSGSGM